MKTPSVLPATKRLGTPSLPTQAPARTTPFGLVRAWVAFWFTPTSPVPLHSLRVAAGLLFLGWALPFAGQVEAMYGLQGWMDTEAYRQASTLAEEPPLPIDWSLFYLAGTDAVLVHVLYWTAIFVFVLFTLGIATRLTSVASWLLVLSMMASPATRFEAEYLLSILAFYLMLAYLLHGQWHGDLSLAGRLLGSRDDWLLFGRSRGEPRPSYAANLAVRLLQIHFALIVVTSAFHKLQFGSWWSGVAFWYPLHPPFTTTEAQLRSLAASRDSYLFFLSLAGYLVLAWQLAFPLFAWRTGGWRWLLVGGALVGWIGSVWIYGLPLFGPAYLVGCLSFLTPSEWSRLRDLTIGTFNRREA